MPDKPRIRITPEHVACLRRAARGSLLAWDDASATVTVLAPGTYDTERMIIAGHGELVMITEMAAASGHPCDDAYLAQAVTGFATESLAEWPEIQAMTQLALPLRKRLASAEVYLDEAPVYLTGRDGLPRLRDHFCAVRNPGLAAIVTVTFAHTRPVEVAVADTGTDALLWRMSLNLSARNINGITAAMGAAMTAALNTAPS
jgi:hypothetical protein